MMSNALTADMRLKLTQPLQVLAASEGMQNLLGYSREDWLTGRVNLLDRIHSADRPLVHPPFAPDLANPSGSMHLRLRHHDGGIRCVRAEYTKERERGTANIVLDLVLQYAKVPWDSSLG